MAPPEGLRPTVDERVDRLGWYVSRALSRAAVGYRVGKAAEGAEAVIRKLLGRMPRVLRGHRGIASPEFIGLLRQQSLSVLDAQLRLDEIAGEADWWISQNDGTITLGELVVQIQFIGSESDRPHEWMWAWANENVDTPMAASVHRLRTAHGNVPELAQPRVHDAARHRRACDRDGGYGSCTR